jgi:2-polyprenyl-6-methoxyphenol hydroxylase-like FAD-dependent oxidoreductase
MSRSAKESSSPRYDAIVVGARVAGSATAMLLARQGLDVLVVERGRPGTDTVSTLALMRCGVMQLHRWGLLDAVREAGTPPVRRTLFHYGDNTLAVQIKPAFGVDALYAPRRTVLDPILVDGARDAGAEVRFRVSVQDLQRDASGRVTGIIGRDEKQRPFSPRAGIVIGADGAKSRVARAAGARLTKSAGASGGTIYGFFRGVGAGAYEWAFNSGVAAGVIPTNDDASCVFASTTAARFDSELRSDFATGFRRVLHEVRPELAERVVAGEPTERLRGFPGFNGHLRGAWGPGWALVGDAGYFKDPITAHGISDALRDAEILTRAVVKSPLGSPEQEAEALAGYESTRDHLSEGLFAATESIARYDWTLTEVQELHRQLSASMKAENEFVTEWQSQQSSRLSTS